MATRKITARDAVIFVPGMFSEHFALTVDDVARRIAVAFDRNAESAAAEFSVTEGHEFDYVGTSKTRMVTVQRSDGKGAAPEPFIDVYELDYRATLMRSYKERTPMRQTFSIIGLLISLLPRYLGSFVRGGKSLGEKIQMLFAGSLLMLMAAYLVFLVCTAVAPALDSPKLLELIAPADMAAANAVMVQIKYVFGMLDEIGQPLIVALTAGGLFVKKGFKQFFTEHAINLASVLDYLSISRQKDQITGQFAGLLEGIAESGTAYRNVHVIGYSFGSIIAVDALFQNRTPTRRFGLVRSLTTVGSPFDLIRSFWPRYFEGRERAAGELTWLNVFSLNDVLSSNFRNDGSVQKDSEFWLGGGAGRLKPRNFPYGGIGAARLNIFERFRRAPQLHIDYWGGSNFASSFFMEIVPAIWRDDAPLS